MAEWVLFSAVAIAAAAGIKLLEKTAREYAVFLSLAAVLFLVGAAVQIVAPVLEWMQSTPALDGTELQWVRVLLKSLGICLLCQITASVCRDAGESSLAFGVELLCRFSVLVQALPFLRELLRAILRLLQSDTG